MPTVQIAQFGGHTSSFAGDCALVSIDDQDDVLVIDTGSTKAWPQKKELATYVGKKSVTLITTHFHADHYQEATHKGLKIVRHLYPKVAAKNAGFDPIEDEKRKSFAFGPGVYDIRKEETGCLVRLYVPPEGDNSGDQNDQCMAVYVKCGDFSFLSFGDMTKDAYIRLAKMVGGHLPAASTTKYPHHGNFPANYLAYYDEQDVSMTAVLISGNSGSYVDATVNALLKRGVGAVYCLARTDDAIKAFQQSWKVTDKPVYICRDATLKAGGVSIEKGMFLTKMEKGMGSRSKMVDSWRQVNEVWDE